VEDIESGFLLQISVDKTCIEGLFLKPAKEKSGLYSRIGTFKLSVEGTSLTKLKPFLFGLRNFLDKENVLICPAKDIVQLAV
jgi:hypothetical protein